MLTTEVGRSDDGIETRRQSVDQVPSLTTSPSSRQGTVLALVIALVLVAIHTVGTRFSTNPDGISYLDITDEVQQRGLSGLVHGYWSPGYPALLTLVLTLVKPSLPREVEVAHALNGALFFVAFAAYWYFLRGVRTRLARDDTRSLVSASWFPAFAFVMFLWHALVQIDLQLLTPDLLLAAWVLLLAGVIVRMSAERSELRASALLGFLTGLAYLTKAALLPFGLPFIAASAFAARRSSAKALRLIVAGAAFTVVAAPFTYSLSAKSGRVTIGDVGPIAWAWMVNDVPPFVHWQGGPPGTGAPVHPTRQIASRPDAFEFATPVAGSYPPWFDPSYWYEGVQPALRLRRVLWLTWQHAHDYAQWLMPALVAAIAVIVLRGLPGSVSDVRRTWPIWVPAVLALFGYALVYVEPRYVAPFFALLVIGAFGALRLPEMFDRRLANALLGAVAASYLVPVASITVPRAVETYRTLMGLSGPSPAASVADALADIGIPKGARAVVVGTGYDAYWPRQARVRLVGEVPESQLPLFWGVPSARRDSVLSMFRGVGASVVVATEIPAWADTTGWAPLGNTGMRYRLLGAPRASRPLPD